MLISHVITVALSCNCTCSHFLMGEYTHAYLPFSISCLMGMYVSALELNFYFIKSRYCMCSGITLRIMQPNDSSNVWNCHEPSRIALDCPVFPRIVQYCPWIVQDSPGLSIIALDCPVLPWIVQDSPGLSSIALDCPGFPWIVHYCPGLSSIALDCPGFPWIVQNCPGLSRTTTSHPGLLWTVPD